MSDEPILGRIQQSVRQSRRFSRLNLGTDRVNIREGGTGCLQNKKKKRGYSASPNRELQSELFLSCNMDSEYQHHMENPLKSLNGLPKRANAFTLCQPAQVPGACLLQGLPDKRFSCFQQTGSYQHFHPCLQTCENDVTKFCEEQSG